MNQEFCKNEKLKSRKQIAQLFSKNNHVFAYPIKTIWASLSEKKLDSTKVMVSVSKKKVKHAVDRNRIKRLIREAYRLNKKLLLGENESDYSPVIMGFIFVGKEAITFAEVEKGMKAALKKARAKMIEMSK